jgi:hypothetical protein
MVSNTKAIKTVEHKRTSIAVLFIAKVRYAYILGIIKTDYKSIVIKE